MSFPMSLIFCQLRSQFISNTMRLLLVFFPLLLALACRAEIINYSGYKVVRSTPHASAQLSFITNDLQKQLPSLSFWQRPTKLNKPVDIFIDPADYPLLAQLLQENEIPTTLLIADVQRLIEKTREENEQFMSLRSGNFTGAFHTLHEINVYLKTLESQNPLVQTSGIGLTLENRTIQMATISTGTDPDKKAIYLECGMHAREWISPSTCLWIINELTSKYNQTDEITQLVDSFDWLITPISNPDGYEYTWKTDRLWRKNRRVNVNAACRGVDSNRNFDANFGGVGSSDDPCSEEYSGAFAFSEAESRAMRDAVSAHQKQIKAVVSIHSQAQVWLSPYGYTTEPPKDYAKMYRAMSAGVAAIEATNGTKFEFGMGSEVLYFTSGTTKDYFYDGLGIVYSYTLELRNSGDGFVPPPSLIAPVATEAWNGLKAMVRIIENDRGN